MEKRMAEHGHMAMLVVATASCSVAESGSVLNTFRQAWLQAAGVDRYSGYNKVLRIQYCYSTCARGQDLDKEFRR